VQAIQSVKRQVQHALSDLQQLSIAELLQTRYDKYRNMGVYFEQVADKIST
jgi:acetyl-CoA carboxylase alpha subunit